MILLACRIAAWVTCKLGIVHVVPAAGSDYIALCWYVRFNPDRAFELMEKWYPIADPVDDMLELGGAMSKAMDEVLSGLGTEGKGREGMEEVNKMLKEAVANGAAIVVYQDDKGFHLGFVSKDAVTDSLARQEDGEDYYAAAMVSANGGDASKSDDLQGHIMKSLAEIWPMAKEIFMP